MHTINKLKKDLGTCRKDLTKLKLTNSELAETALNAAAQIDNLQKRITFIDGNAIPKAYKGADGLECFIYTFAYGLAFRPVDQSIKVIRDLDFHIEVKTNRAINLTVSISTWFVPFLPDCQDLDGYMPQSLYDDIQDIFVDRCRESHAHLIERMEWAKETSLDELDCLTEREVDILAKSNFFSLYSVMHSNPDQLDRAIKGISKKTAINLRERLMENVVKPWEAKEWSREQRGLKA